MKSSNPGSEPGLAANPPALSLVIATRRRAGFLRRCLDSLLDQDAPRGSFELILVDNAASPDPALLELCRSEAYAPLSPTYSHHPTPGSSGARNRGAALARGALLGFLDDDVILPPTWAGSALSTASSTQARIFGGPYFPSYISPRPPWFKDEYASGEYGAQPCWLDGRRYLFAANLVFERSLFLELGGFSTDLGPGTRHFFGEETDLQHRAAKRGIRIWYDPGLWLHHHASPAKMSLRYFLKSSWQKGRVKSIIFGEDLSPGKASMFRARVSWLRQALAKSARLPFLILQTPLRDRQKYPFYQNFVIEKICPELSSIAMLASLVRGTTTTNREINEVPHQLR